MSPSRQHLEIYKMLGKHVIKTKISSKQYPDPDKMLGTLKQGYDILYLVFDIILLAFKHAYPLQQWQQVWTIFII